MALGLSLHLAFNNYVLQLCKAIQSCSGPQVLEHILRDLLNLLTVQPQKNADHCQGRAELTSGALAQALDTVQRELLSDHDPIYSVGSALQQHLEVITCTLLPGELSATCNKGLQLYAAPSQRLHDWLYVAVLACTANIGTQENISLAQRLFQQAPAVAVLQALTAYTTSVTIADEEQVDLLRPRGQAVGTDLAVAWLAQRFASPHSTGIQQLGHDIAHSLHAAQNTSASPASDSIALRCHEVAQGFVALTDRSFRQMEPAFESTQFIPHAVSQLWKAAHLLPAHDAGSKKLKAEDSMAALGHQESQAMLAFVGEVCTKFCRRGFVSEVAQTLWQQSAQRQEAAPEHLSGGQHYLTFTCQLQQARQAQQGQQPQQAQQPQQTQQGQQAKQAQQVEQPQQAQQVEQPQQAATTAQDTSCNILLAVTNSDVLEKLFRALLLQACQSSNEDQELALMQTVTKKLWSQKHFRHLMTSKLLLQPQLPLPALHLVVQLLDSLSSVGDYTKAAPPERAMLPLLAASVGLAEIWADKVMTSRLPIVHQAYIGAAMAMCIAKTDKSCLDCTKGLLPNILQGVSVRLDNAIEAIRRQAMRVGNAFSKALDPSKPLLFANFSLDVLPEEHWNPSAVRLDPERPLQLRSAPVLAPATPSPSPHRPQTRAASTVPLNGALESHAQLAQQQTAPKHTHAHPMTTQVGFDSAETTANAESHPLSNPRSNRQIAQTEQLNGCDDEQHQSVGSQQGDKQAGSSKEDEETKHNDKGVGWGSDHETDSDDDSLEAYDLSEGDDDGLDSGDRPMQLRDIAAALRKSEDVQDKLRALKLLEGALLAAPDELQHYAGEMSRALLHLRTPDWADQEATKAEDKPQVQRYRSIVALLVQVPHTAGNNLTEALYSPHLDMHQRMLILETLASAAQQLADPHLRLRAGHGAQALPAQKGPVSTAAVLEHAPRSQQVGRSRRWGVKALQKQQEQQHLQQHLQRHDSQQPRKAANMFLDVALSWTAGLLRDCDQKGHGVDLFGRDPLLLGRLLITLGTFVECCGAAPVTSKMAACVLELVRSQGVHGHAQPYVRRSALLASAQVLATLPPSRLAGAMTTSNVMVSADAVLVDQLQWVQAWVTDVAVQDVDMQCQQLAAACQNLQGSLAAKALEALASHSSQGVTDKNPFDLPNMQSPSLLVDAFQSGFVSLKLV